MGSNRFRIYSDSYLKKQLLQPQLFPHAVKRTPDAVSNALYSISWPGECPHVFQFIHMDGGVLWQWKDGFKQKNDSEDLKVNVLHQRRGVSSVSSPYRVQIVSRSMKKSWYLANSRRYNIHRALRNLKGDEHDQPFLWAQRGLKGLSVLQFSCHSPIIWLGHMATRTRFEVPFWRKYGGGRFLKHPKQEINGLQNAMKKQVVLLSKHVQLWRVFSSILTP